MPDFEWKHIRFQVDDDGFMERPEDWNEEIALALANSDNITLLTDNHWRVINFLRTYFKQYGIAPMIRKLCKETGFPLKDIYELFPSGPAKGACRIAGLSKPTGCV